MINKEPVSIQTSGVSGMDKNVMPILRTVSGRHNGREVLTEVANQIKMRTEEGTSTKCEEHALKLIEGGKMGARFKNLAKVWDGFNALAAGVATYAGLYFYSLKDQVLTQFFEPALSHMPLSVFLLLPSAVSFTAVYKVFRWSRKPSNKRVEDTLDKINGQASTYEGYNE